MTVGDRIKHVRKRESVSQVELAKKCNISKQTLYKYENNIITNIPSDKIELIAKTLGTTPEYLMGWVDYDPKIIEFNKKLEFIADAISAKTNYDSFAEDILAKVMSSFSENEEILLSNFNNLTDEGQKKLIDYSNDLLEIEKYKKQEE